MYAKLATGTIGLFCLFAWVFASCTDGPETVFRIREDSSDWEHYDDKIPPTICTPGSEKCMENLSVVGKCNGTGTDWEEFLFCSEGTLCMDGQCLPENCSSGQTECGPTKLYECNDQGRWEGTVCPQNQPCILGKCIECLRDAACDEGEICVEGACQYLEPEITTSELPDGVVGAPYEFALESRGGSPPLAWTLSEGLLPDGIELTQEGALTGTPKRAGTEEFTVTLADSLGEKFSQSLSLQIFAEGPVLITSKSINNAKEGVSYSFDLAAAGGTSPYAWQILDGALPSGLTLSSTGVIAGVPDEIGTFPLKIRVIDASSPPTYDAKDFTFDVRMTPLEIVGGQQIDLVLLKVIILQPLIPFLPYSAQLEARGGVQPYTWSQAPPPPGLNWIISEWGLPAGLKMNDTGRISGLVMDTSDANTVSIPGLPNISGYFFMGKVADSRSPSGSKNAVFCIPTISF